MQTIKVQPVIKPAYEAVIIDTKKPSFCIRVDF